MITMIPINVLKTPYLECLWALPSDLKHNEPCFLIISTDLLCLQVAQVPRSRDLSIFVRTTDDRQTDCFTPCCACAHAG
jgi:hypothetical protein